MLINAIGDRGFITLATTSTRKPQISLGFYTTSAGKRPHEAAAAGLMVSDFGLLRHLQRVIYLNAEISDCALQLSMPEQQLYGSEIPGSFVD